MLTYALTGGIGMGKSTAAAWLRSQGIPLVDADELARQVTQPGEEGLWLIVQHFGEDILRPDGTLNRGLLGAIVFANEESRRQLEALLHPLIRQRWHDWCRELRQSPAPPRFCVVVIPLLFEIGRAHV